MARQGAGSRCVDPMSSRHDTGTGSLRLARSRGLLHWDGVDPPHSTTNSPHPVKGAGCAVTVVGVGAGTGEVEHRLRLRGLVRDRVEVAVRQSCVIPCWGTVGSLALSVRDAIRVCASGDSASTVSIGLLRTEPFRQPCRGLVGTRNRGDRHGRVALGCLPYRGAGRVSVPVPGSS